MKHSNKGLLVLVLAIVVSFAAAQAFGDGPKGPKGPKFEPEFRIVEGCVLRIHDDAVVGITLCLHPDIVDDTDDCSKCDVEDEDTTLETILGIGPPHYWDHPCIANIDENGDIIIDNETGSFCITDGPDVAVPEIGDFVTIKVYDVLCSDDQEDALPIAFWAQTEELAADEVVLLRDPDTLKSLWKGLGNKKEKKK